MEPTKNAPLEEGPLPPQGDQRDHLRDFLGALLLLVVSVAFTIASLRIPFTSSSWVWYTSPGIFALVMALCLGLCSLAVGIRGFRGWTKERHAARPVRWREGLHRWGMGRFVAATAIILCYILLLGKVPFLVASVGLVLTLGTAFREGRFLDSLRPSVIASLVVVAVAVIISKVFGILFP